MPEKSKKTVKSLKESVRAGSYEVDTKAVADAIIRRRAHIALLEPSEPQNECSKPDSSAPEPTNLTSPSPGPTEPINVTPRAGANRARALWRLRLAFGGTQKQSS